MNKLQNIVAYFCASYPHQRELSNARLTKLVYLADWFSALVDDKQLTDIEWLFNHYGPYVDDVITSIKNVESFSIKHETTTYGSDTLQISFCGNENEIQLFGREKQILNAVIEKTKHLYFNDFIDYVYATYPVTSKIRYSYLNLVALARECKSEKSALTSETR